MFSCVQVRIMEQRLVQAEWTPGSETVPETKEKEQAITKLTTQVEEQVGLLDSKNM